MQDRFRFRVWDSDNKVFDYIDLTDIEQTIRIFDSYENYFWSDYFKDKPEYIMQSTGLKDKNGNLIYEGDIVKITREKWTKERYNRFYIVCWNRTQWQLGLIKYQRAKAQPNRRPDRKMPFKNIVSFDDYTPLKEFALCEVIGNIYENKELLND